MTTNRFRLTHIMSIVVAVILTITSLRLSQDIPTFVRVIPIILAWLAVLMRSVPTLAKPMVWLWRFPALLWLLELVAFVGVMVVWLINFQPAIGIPLSGAAWYWLVACAYGLIVLPTAGRRSQAPKPIGWVAGPLITLTTLVLIVLGLELGLRYVWVMSDNFQFSKMHRNWSRLYWKPLNEIGEGYRDYPPAPNDERTHILVAGDSLAAGYGVNNIDDTFPHQLGDLLGDNYTVNLVAQPGWGISTALGSLQSYPTKPDIIVLSHYINDIAEGPAGQQYGQPFPSIRLDPPENRRWWVENFYIANFLHYRVFLYTQHDSVGLYNDWLRGAYQNSAVWNAYQDEMKAWIDWANTNDAELVVLVWPNLLDIEGWRDVTDPVVTYFEERDIPVVDMGDDLLGEAPRKLTVNRFDAHPSVYSHQVAAGHLHRVLTGGDE